MMKLTKWFAAITLALAFAVGAVNLQAQCGKCPQKGKCCEEAKKAGKTCDKCVKGEKQDQKK